MKVDIKPKQLIEASTDDRGRFTLGSDYANQEVTLLVVEDSDDDE